MQVIYTLIAKRITLFDTFWIKNLFYEYIVCYEAIDDKKNIPEIKRGVLNGWLYRGHINA